MSSSSFPTILMYNEMAPPIRNRRAATSPAFAMKICFGLELESSLFICL